MDLQDMNAQESTLLAALKEAGAKGLSPSAAVTRTKIAKSKIDGVFANLKSGGAVAGPFKKGTGKLYFIPSAAPSRKAAQAQIEEILRDSGTKLISRTALAGQLSALFKPFFADALSALKADGKIIEFKFGPSFLYAHRAPVLELLQVDESADPVRAPKPALTLADIRPAYEKLKAQQGGISVVKIFDLLQATGAARDELHALLRKAARNGRVSLHPATTAHYPAEVVEAGIMFQGERDPRVTVVFEEDA